ANPPRLTPVDDRDQHFFIVLFLFDDAPTHHRHTLSLHDALPILHARRGAAHGGQLGHRLLGVVLADVVAAGRHRRLDGVGAEPRSEEHTSELQSRSDLVCRLLLEKKKASWSMTSVPVMSLGIKSV